MTFEQRKVSTVSELLAGAQDSSVRELAVTTTLTDVPTFRLSPGKALIGEAGAALSFSAGQDGIELSADNRVASLALRTDSDRRAIFNDATVEALGRLALENSRARRRSQRPCRSSRNRYRGG